MDRITKHWTIHWPNLFKNNFKKKNNPLCCHVHTESLYFAFKPSQSRTQQTVSGTQWITGLPKRPGSSSGYWSSTRQPWVPGLLVVNYPLACPLSSPPTHSSAGHWIDLVSPQQTWCLLTSEECAESAEIIWLQHCFLASATKYKIISASWLVFVRESIYSNSYSGVFSLSPCAF